MTTHERDSAGSVCLPIGLAQRLEGEPVRPAGPVGQEGSECGLVCLASEEKSAGAHVDHASGVSDKTNLPEPTTGPSNPDSSALKSSLVPPPTHPSNNAKLTAGMAGLVDVPRPLFSGLAQTLYAIFLNIS
jgi:hypothetical protein